MRGGGEDGGRNRTVVGKVVGNTVVESRRWSVCDVVEMALVNLRVHWYLTGQEYQDDQQGRDVVPAIHTNIRICQIN